MDNIISQMFDLELVSMKVKDPTSGTIIEMKMNPPPTMPMTIDNVHYYFLLDNLARYRSTLIENGYQNIAKDLGELIEQS